MVDCHTTHHGFLSWTFTTTSGHASETLQLHGDRAGTINVSHFDGVDKYFTFFQHTTDISCDFVTDDTTTRPPAERSEETKCNSRHLAGPTRNLDRSKSSDSEDNNVLQLTPCAFLLSDAKAS